MTVKVVYLNGYFEFVRNVENICTNNMWFVLILKNGAVKKLDRRLKLEVSYQEVGEMKIIGNGLEYELTSEEVARVHDEFVMSFMKKQVIENYGIKDEGLAEELARNAYDRYCEGRDETEGECVDWSYSQRFSNNSSVGACYVVL